MHWLLLIPFLPLAGALINGLIALVVSAYRQPATVAASGNATHEPVDHGRLSPGLRALVSLIGVGLPFAACAVGWKLFLELLQMPPAGRLMQIDLGPWFGAGAFHVDWSFMLDPLSMVMVLVVTTVGALIHLYSVGYMAEDAGFARYFCYLNLFMASMLLLVMGRDLVLMFVGWEGVGLCSYLLIGFWFDDLVKATAGFKAFVVNRIGDFGFLLGMFMLWWALAPKGLSTFNMVQLPAAVTGLSAATATAIALLLFVGAVGKSAQIPLHVWLPDAMAGPTPVSALIHAATMVTAGVYMVSRLHAIYELSPVALPIVGLIGGVTALMAATVACAQTNIKRVIAWSTISQLGYMFMAVGASSYRYGVFHLVTHAFFKGLFFLSAGAVIHALHGEEDLSRMGGLWKVRQLRGTAIAFTIAALANAGLVPFSGFVSKDAIMLALVNHQMPVQVALGWATAFLTAFYSVRLVMLTFAGESRDPHLAEKAHAPGWEMGIPLWILSIGSVVVGGLNWPAELGGKEWFSSFLAPVFGPSGTAVGPDPNAGVVVGITTVLVVLGILVAWLRYREPSPTLSAPWAWLSPFWTFFVRKWYWDELYGAIAVRPAMAVAEGLSTSLDSVLSAFTDAFADVYDWAARVAAAMETGMVRAYGFAMILGTLALLAFAVVAGQR